MCKYTHGAPDSTLRRSSSSTSSRRSSRRSRLLSVVFRVAAAARLAAEAEAHYPASHLWWGVWAALQAATFEGEFDYAAYAERRIDAYRERRMDPSPSPSKKTEKQDKGLEASD